MYLLSEGLLKSVVSVVHTPCHYTSGQTEERPESGQSHWSRLLKSDEERVS